MIRGVDGCVDERMEMPSRRTLIATGASLLAIPSLGALPNSELPLRFRIMRKGSRIGTHALTFSRSGDALSVSIAVEIAVSFGPIRLFHYSLSAIERWVRDGFVSLDAKCDDDGEQAWCRVRRDSGELAVEGSLGSYVAPSNALAATHWNKNELSGAMINPENGRLLRPAVTDLGKGQVALASGAKVEAQHFGWRGESNLDLWYSLDGAWVALHAVTHSGEELVYEKL